MTSNNIFILESKTKSRMDIAILKFTIEVRDVNQLNNLFSQLRQVKGVVNIARESRAAATL
jgi:(p)ppGpp synthase/HD superfamily hydrolase